MTETKPLKVAILGSTGYVGSHTCIELLSRGHYVTGLSRNPEKIGTHPRYTPKSIDLENASIADFIEAFKGHDAIVKYTLPLCSMLTCSTYGPHTAGEGLPYRFVSYPTF